MDTLEQLLQQLEQMIVGAKKSMLSSTDAVINRNQALELIDRIRAAYPGVLRDAKYIVDDCENLKQQSMNYCKQIVDDAEKQRDRLLDQSEITRQATEEAAALKKQTEETLARGKYEAKCNLDKMLADSEVTLIDALTLIRNNREDLRSGSDAAPQQQPQQQAQGQPVNINPKA